MTCEARPQVIIEISFYVIKKRKENAQAKQCK